MLNELDELSFKEILGYSIEAEGKAYEFYKELSEHTKSSLVSARYLSLADDEKMHKRELLKLHEKIFGDRKVEVPENDHLPPHEGDVKLETVRNLMEALDAAIENERNAYKIYKYLSKRKKEHKKLFGFLAMMEHTHAESLTQEKKLYQGYIDTKPKVRDQPYEAFANLEIEKRFTM